MSNSAIIKTAMINSDASNAEFAAIINAPAKSFDKNRVRMIDVIREANELTISYLHTAPDGRHVCFVEVQRDGVSQVFVFSGVAAMSEAMYEKRYGGVAIENSGPAF